MQQPDKLTETRGSLEIKSSFLRRFYGIMCPCFSPVQEKKYTNRNDPDYFASDLQNRSSTREYELPPKNSIDFGPYLSYKLPEPFIIQQMGTGSYPNEQELIKKGHKSKSFMHNLSNSPRKQRETFRETVDLTRQLNVMIYTKKKEWYNFPVFKFKQGELILLGKHNKNLLAQISTVKLQPSPTAVQKQLALKINPQKSQMQKKLQDFWNSRYYYFEKFDQMIQIDKQTIPTLTPEAVSDYIAGKCYDCKTALDAFSGIGHNATKLGSVCQKVICVEQNVKKCNMLINNAKCYEIYDIQLFMKPFLEIQLKQKVDVAVVHPTLVNQDYQLSSMCESKHFKPALSQIIKKSLQVAKNIVLLLPPNISIKDICYQISKSIQQISEKLCSSCSVKIEKIYFRNNLSYVAIFFGPNVQHEIKINSELGFIYKWLKNPQDKNFSYKKLIKYLREKYGIIRLLNIVSESVSIERQNMNEMEKLIEFIRQRKLILQHRLQGLLIEEKTTPRKVTLLQNQNDNLSSFSNSPELRVLDSYSFSKQQFKQSEQIEQVEQAQTVSERTQSFYSNGSGFSAFKKCQTITESMKRDQNSNKAQSDHNIEKQSNSSSIVVRKILEDDGSIQKQSKSPASPTHNSVWRINNNNNNNLKPYRHTLQNKKIEKQLMSQKQNLKKILIEK